MSQHLEFNWGLKVKHPEQYKTGKDYCIVKGGYRVYPLTSPIDLLDGSKKTVGKIVVKKLVIKYQDFFTDEEANQCGFSNAFEMKSHLEMEYPDAGLISTFIHFERTS